MNSNSFFAESLSKWIQNWKFQKKIPPVLLLTDPRGIAHSVAQSLARWVLCENRESHPSPEACENCPTCLRTKAGSCVDFVEITLDADETSLKIDQFRKLKASSGFQAYEKTARVILISDADKMTPSAANSILKLLEEPPAGWIFLLTAGDPTLLLPTLVSRCQVIRLKPVSKQKLKEALLAQGISDSRSGVCAELAQGSLSRALLYSRDEIWEKREFLFEFLSQPAKNIHAFVDWASQEPLNAQILIDLLEQIIFDLIAASSIRTGESYEWRQFDHFKDLELVSRSQIRVLGSRLAAREFWLSLADRLAEARNQLHLPLNRKLLLQDLLLPWVGAYS